MFAGQLPAISHGTHYLREWAVRRIIAAAKIRPDELIVDLGAGTGALTLPLARLGARVIAVENYHPAVHELRKRSAALPITVVARDIRTFRWPQQSFRIVANPPFALSTALLDAITGFHQMREALPKSALLLYGCGLGSGRQRGGQWDC